jgi:hypothetical protein
MEESSSTGDLLRGRGGGRVTSSVLQERLSPVPISPAQEAVNQSISLLQQPRSSPKKRATTNKAFPPKEKSAVLPTFNRKATSKTVEEEDDPHVASPLSPRDANKKHGVVQEKPKLNLTSPHLRDYVSQMSRSRWIAESSAGDTLQVRDAASSVIQERLSLLAVPITPDQEARTLSEVSVNQSIALLLQQPRSSPKKCATSKKTFLSKKKSSAIPTSNQKATFKTVEEDDNAHVASYLPPKGTFKTYGAQKKPMLNLTSSNKHIRAGGLSRQVSIGSEEPQVKAGSSSLPRDSEGHSTMECELLRHDHQRTLKHVREDVTMIHLKTMMLKSDETQLKLQEWDKLHGLPKSHSQTMVNTSRSRRQLREGIIIPKWDGTPLINDETELGKPKKRQRKDKHQDDPSGKSRKF